MGFIGGVLFIGGIMALFNGLPYGIMAIIVGWFMMQSELDSGNKNNNSSSSILNNNVNKSTNNTYKKPSSIKTTNNSYNQKTMEVYVIVRFDNYPKQYTYLAPLNRFLKTGERVRIKTGSGEIKWVTVVKGNFKCPVKTDMHYSRINIL